MIPCNVLHAQNIVTRAMQHEQLALSGGNDLSLTEYCRLLYGVNAQYDLTDRRSPQRPQNIMAIKMITIKNNNDVNSSNSQTKIICAGWLICQTETFFL